MAKGKLDHWYFCFCFSDGNSNINSEDTLREAALLRARGTQIIVIPIGEKFANMPEIEGIASEPISDMIVGVNSFSQLPGIVMNITMALCNGRFTVRNDDLMTSR